MDYKKEIIRMIEEYQGEEWLRIIYIFVKRLLEV